MSLSTGRAMLVMQPTEGTLGTADTLIAWVVNKPMTIYRASFLTTTAHGAWATAAVLTLSKTQASPVVAIDAKVNISLVASEGVGTETDGVVEADGDLPLDVEAGDTLTFAVSTAAVTSTTGAGFWLLELEVRGEGA